MPFIKEITVLLHNEIDDTKYRSNGTNFRNKVGSRYINYYYLYDKDWNNAANIAGIPVYILQFQNYVNGIVCVGFFSLIKKWK